MDAPNINSKELSRNVDLLRTNVQQLQATTRGHDKEVAAQQLRHDAALRQSKEAQHAAEVSLAALEEKHSALKAQHNSLQAHLGSLKRQQSVRVNAAANILGQSDASDGSLHISEALGAPDSQVAQEAAATIAQQATDIRELQVLLKSTEDAFEAQQVT